MVSPGRSFINSFNRLDAVLAAAALAGALLFFIVAPRLHPDTTATEHISKVAALAIASEYATSNAGLVLEDVRTTAELRRNEKLLDSLQQRLGRPEARRRLRQDDVPGYYWYVGWDAENNDDQSDVAWAWVTLDGRLLAFESKASPSDLLSVHPDALTSALGLTGSADSLEARDFTFNLSERQDASSAAEQIEAGERVVLGYAEAVRLARFHLDRSALANDSAEVDSIFVSGDDGIVMATVRFASMDTVLGRWRSADVEVLPGGTLDSIDPRWVEEGESEFMEFNVAQLYDVSAAVAYGILCFILLVVFFRRLNARLIDTRTALRDGLVCGVAGAAASFGEVITGVVTSPIELIMVGVGIGILAALAAVFMFFIIGTVTSVVRDVWSEKLQTLDLLRSAFVRNVPVGIALVRGVLVAFVLCGLATLVFLTLPGVSLDLPSDAYYQSGIPGLSALKNLGGSFFLAVFVVIGAVMGVGGLLRLKARSGIVVVLGITAFLVVGQIAPGDMRPFAAEAFTSGLLGVAIALTAWRFDVLTVLTTYFVFSLVLGSHHGLMMTDSPEFIDSLITLGMLAILFVIGFVGVASGKTGTDIPVIVPEYIEELAQNARLTRELELAREVQLSFLPSENPRMPGLEIASICLPAYEVGGDYYDFFRVDDRRLVVVVGDVSGKGMEAAFYMTLMKGILQSLMSIHETPTQILNRANEVFRTNAPRGMFMSMVLGVLDIEERTWTHARAGHNPVLIQRVGGSAPEELKPNGAAIGLTSSRLFAGSIEEMTVNIEPGDVLLIYTDGVTEAMNGRRQLYDEGRLEQVVAAAKGCTASGLVTAVVDDVEAFRGDAPRHDDMTMVAIRLSV